MDKTEKTIEYRAVKISDEKLKDVLPTGVYSAAKTLPHLIISGREGDREVAMMMIVARRNSGEAEILYLDCTETDKTKAMQIYKDILKTGRDIVFESGINTLLMYWSDVPEVMKRLAELARDCGFLPVSLDGVLLEYSIDDVMYDDALKKLPDTKKKLKLNFTVLEKDDYRLKTLFRSTDKYGITLDPNLYDSRFSRFYYQEGELKACIIGVKASNKVLYIPAVYADGSGIASAALTIMLEEIIRAAYAVFPVESRFVIQSYYTHMEKGILRVFDNPINEYQIHEYICIKDKL